MRKTRCFLCSLTMISITLIVFSCNSDRSENESSGTVSTSDDSIYTPPEIHHAESQEQEDSLFRHLLEELAHHAGHEALHSLLDKINEKVNSGNWEKANEWYDETINMLEKDGKGENIEKKYEDELAKLKTEITKLNPNAGLMDPSQQVNINEAEGMYATETITNATPYELTIYYSGTSGKIVNILPSGTSTITLPPGFYNLVARVSAPNVVEYSGSQNYRGVHYANEYYITQ